MYSTMTNCPWSQNGKTYKHIKEKICNTLKEKLAFRMYKKEKNTKL